MKKVIILSLVVLIVSCKRNAEIPGAEKRVCNDSTQSPIVSYIKTFEKAQTIIQPEFRSCSLFLYPDVDEVNNFQYKFSDKNIWRKVLSELSYHKDFPVGFTLDYPAHKKVEWIVMAIMSLGEVRDKIYPKLLLAEKKKIPWDIKEAAIVEELKKRFKCYQIKKGRNKRKCLTKYKKGVTRKKVKTAKSCTSFLGRKFRFVNLDETEKREYQEWKKKCNEFVTGYALIQEMYTQVENDHNAPKDIVLNILEKAQKSYNTTYLFLCNSNDGTIDDSVSKSMIKFGKDNKSVKELKLVMDFTLKDPNLKGMQEYSLKNKKIYNLDFYTNRDGVKMLDFTIDTTEFLIDVTSAMTISKTMGVRFVGEIKAYYPDGLIRKGTVKLELDLK